jgi:hypothetical protein
MAPEGSLEGRNGRGFQINAEITEMSRYHCTIWLSLMKNVKLSPKNIHGLRGRRVDAFQASTDKCGVGRRRIFFAAKACSVVASPPEIDASIKNLKKAIHDASRCPQFLRRCR